jgi:hypothetical protein
MVYTMSFTGSEHEVRVHLDGPALAAALFGIYQYLFSWNDNPPEHASAEAQGRMIAVLDKLVDICQVEGVLDYACGDQP